MGRRLVIRVAALVVAAAVLLGALTVLATRTLLINQIDGQLESVASRQQQGPGGRPDRGSLVQAGQPIRTIYAAYTTADRANVDSGLLKEGGGRPATLASDAVDQLSGIAFGNPTKQSVEIPGLGHYRVAVYQGNFFDGSTGTLVPVIAVVGIPLDDIDDTLAQIIGLELVLGLLAAGGAVLAARAVVANSLRPLNRLAATATQVSELELGRGDVALAVRVPQEDADPRSEVGRVGQAFNHMLSNVDGALGARQASERKLRQFVADASHELRNPLAAIRGYAELTRRSRAEITPDAAFAMSRVESEADRMSRLVEDMLLLARLDSGPNLDLGATDLTETIINATSDARVAGPDHRWSLDLPDHPIVVVADRHRVHQVVANLLANARTHTPPGTAVQAGLRTEGDRAIISVTDDGPGVPPDIQGRVFERFTRADTSRARAEGSSGSGSTGLGLAIVSAVVEAHHGDVWVESRPGRTRFSIALPLAAGVRADGPTFGG